VNRLKLRGGNCAPLGALSQNSRAEGVDSRDFAVGFEYAITQGWVTYDSDRPMVCLTNAGFAAADDGTNQAKAMRLLQAIYDATRNQTEPVFISTLSTGLSAQDAEVAWYYLRDKGLIQTYKIPYTAIVNAAGIEAIEVAKRSPDQPSANFPSVTYNIVSNRIQVGEMHNSPVQQGGVHSTAHQAITYSHSDLGDVSRLIKELTAHLHELQLDASQRRKADAQIATLKAQLSDEPDPVILKQAGRTLRNITEGAIGSLLATAAQPSIWAWVLEAMHRLFT
jgi:hypothetical protein